MRRKPQWWSLYLLVPFMIGLLVLLEQMHLAGIMKQGAELCVVLLAYGLAWHWLDANASALEYEVPEATERQETEGTSGTAVRWVVLLPTESRAGLRGEGVYKHDRAN